MIHSWWGPLAIAAAGLAACPPTIKEAASGAGGSHAASSSNAGGGAGDAGGQGGGGAGTTACGAPDGAHVCGGPNQCPIPEAGCCGRNELELCLDKKLLDTPGVGDFPCDDGLVEVQAEIHSNLGSGFWLCMPFDVGILMANNGGGSRVRYADYGLWTGAALPEPATCPTLPDVKLCGGNCGECAKGELCTGRSPLHPYSFCVTENTSLCRAQGGSKNCTKSGLGCFVFTVESEAQALADEQGYCMPLADCQAAAAELPGGGKCMPAE